MHAYLMKMPREIADKLTKLGMSMELIAFLAANEDNIKGLFPKTFTHIANLDLEHIVPTLNSNGFEIEKPTDLLDFIALGIETGFLLQDGPNIKANPHSAFMGEIVEELSVHDVTLQ